MNAQQLHSVRRKTQSSIPARSGAFCMSLLTRNGVLGSALREFIAPPASAIALDLDWIASFCGIDRASLRRQNCKEMPTINNDITKDAAGRTHVRTRVQAHPRAHTPALPAAPPEVWRGATSSFD